MLLKRREFEMVSRQEIEKTEELKKCNFYDPHFRGSFKLHFQPRRATKNSAAYDLYSPIRIVLKPGEIAKIPTGFKIKMPKNEAFFIYIRSSYGAKDIILPAGVNIIDADYYNNESNEGEIFFQLINLSPYPIIIPKGTYIGQGIIKKYYTTDDDKAIGERTGGFGSTNK